MLKKAIEKIKEQRDASKDYNVKYCATELIKILQYNPDKAELVLQDLENPDMSVEKCEKKISAYFHVHRSNAEISGPIKVISDFYGLNIDVEKVTEQIYSDDETTGAVAKPKVASLF